MDISVHVSRLEFRLSIRGNGRLIRDGTVRFGLRCQLLLGGWDLDQFGGRQGYDHRSFRYGVRPCMSYKAYNDLKLTIHARTPSRPQLETPLRTPMDLARPPIHNGLFRASIPLVARPSRPLRRCRTLHLPPDRCRALFGIGRQAERGHDDPYD